MSAVHWECWIDAGRAAFERLGRAVVTTRARVAETYTIGDTTMITISASHEDARRFVDVAGARDLRYRSPRVLKRGVMCPVYTSADAEIGAARDKLDRARASARSRPLTEASFVEFMDEMAPGWREGR